MARWRMKIVAELNVVSIFTEEEDSHDNEFKDVLAHESKPI
jgi:hypothetical protein